jgi:hypothetical protein
MGKQRDAGCCKKGESKFVYTNSSLTTFHKKKETRKEVGEGEQY